MIVIGLGDGCNEVELDNIARIANGNNLKKSFGNKNIMTRKNSSNNSSLKKTFEEIE